MASPLKKLLPKHYAAMDEILLAKKPRARIAETYGVSLYTLRHWCSDPLFKAAMEERRAAVRAESLRAAVGDVAAQGPASRSAAAAKLEAGADEAAETLLAAVRQRGRNGVVTKTALSAALTVLKQAKVLEGEKQQQTFVQISDQSFQVLVDTFAGRGHALPPPRREVLDGEAGAEAPAARELEAVGA